MSPCGWFALVECSWIIRPSDLDELWSRSLIGGINGSFIGGLVGSSIVNLTAQWLDTFESLEVSHLFETNDSCNLISGQIVHMRLRIWFLFDDSAR